jgi:hypothetical protein
MAMQTDVLSAHLSAAGSYYAGRTRLKGIVITPKATTAATFEIRNGGASATVLFTMVIPSLGTPNSFYILVPDQGILASSGLYLTLSVGSVTGITVFYG